MSKKKQMLAIVVIVITLVISIVGATYAYFSVTITGNDNASNIITNAGTLSLLYEEGNTINVSGAIPGWGFDKYFMVTNTGTIAVDYNIVWSELFNEIQNEDLVYSISKTTYSSIESAIAGDIGETTEVLAETAVPLTASNILTDISIGAGEIHYYFLNITFLNKSTDQSINQGKTFAGKIEVTTEYMEEPNTLISSMRYPDGTTSFLGSPIQRQEIEAIEFVDHKNIPINAISSWDVSTKQDGSIMAWYELIGSNGRYKVTIGSEEQIYANANSSSLFSELWNLNQINLTYLDTSQVFDMQKMFSSTGSDVFILDLGTNFDTSKVTNMSSMFNNTGNKNPSFTLNLGSNFDTSNVTNMNRMFSRTGQDNSNFTLDLGEKFDTSNVMDMEGMFCYTGGSNHANIILSIENRINTDVAEINNKNYFYYDNSVKKYCGGGSD